MIAEIPSELLGPGAALVLALVILTLFYTGKILPRNTVPREDYDKLMEVNTSYAAALGLLTKAVDNLVTAARKNGGVP